MRSDCELRGLEFNTKSKSWSVEQIDLAEIVRKA